MQLSITRVFFALVLLFAVYASAAASEQKAFIVSYPDDTPNSVLDAAKAKILSAGGAITHEYKLIKAFAAKASAASIESVQTLGAKYNALVEEDKQVHAQNGAF